MRNDTIPNRRSITAREVRELLADPQWTQDAEMSKLFRFRVYMHPDGRVITVFINKRGVLYASQKAFAILADQLKARALNPFQVGHHILKDRLPGGRDFPQYVPQLVNELAELLKIPRDNLDCSMESLMLVEKKVRRLGRVKCLESAIFPGLIAYVSEVMRQAVDGRWEMILSDTDKETWEPWIIDPQGRSCNAFSFLFDVLTEDPLSIRGMAAVEINIRHVPHPGKRSSGISIPGMAVSIRPPENPK